MGAGDTPPIHREALGDANDIVILSGAKNLTHDGLRNASGSS
jgi:hypothetical protein